MVSGVFFIPLNPLAAAPESTANDLEQRSLPLRQFIADDDNALVRVVASQCLKLRWPLNPLVFVGPSGTGKSMLSRGIAARWSHQHSRRSAVISTGGDFARAYATAIQTDAVGDLRRRFRSTDFLLIDDLHQMTEKRSAQIELMHTLDALTRKNCPILLTLSSLPIDGSGLLSGLASRIAAGLTVTLSPPGIAARHEILQALATHHRVDLSHEALSVLARELSGTVPQLNGAMVQLVHTDPQVAQPLDVRTAKQLITNHVGTRAPSLSSITRKVARYFGQTTSLLRGPTRRQAVVQSRGIAIYVSRRLTRLSFGQIGSYYGDRDHSTVLHAYRKIERIMKTDETIRKAIDEILDHFASSFEGSSPFTH